MEDQTQDSTLFIPNHDHFIERGTILCGESLHRSIIIAVRTLVNETKDSSLSEKNAPLGLVLGGGGARAAYQVGILRGIADMAGDLKFPIVSGVSAGAINAAGLVSSEGTLSDTVGQLEKAWLSLSLRDVFDPTLLSIAGSVLRWTYMVLTRGSANLFEARSILDSTPLRRTLNKMIDNDAICRNIRSGRLKALGVTTTNYANGRTTTFVQGPHDVNRWERAGRVGVSASIGVDHIMASGALPLIFPAVEIEGRYYGDGSIRQTAPLAPAIHMGAGRLLVISIRYRKWKGERSAPFRGYPPAAQIAGMMFNAVFMDALQADTERLLRINRSVESMPAHLAHPDGLRSIELKMLEPSRDLGAMAGECADDLPQTLRYLLTGIGGHELSQSDLLSYLLFERSYIERLLELGRQDLIRSWDDVAPLLLD